MIHSLSRVSSTQQLRAAKVGRNTGVLLGTRKKHNRIIRASVDKRKRLETKPHTSGDVDDVNRECVYPEKGIILLGSIEFRQAKRYMPGRIRASTSWVAMLNW